MIFFHKTPALIKMLYPSLTWSMPTGEKKIYLTFDDGPIPELTPWVMQQLTEYQIRATFFCVGENIERNTTIAEELLSEGHKLGNHTFNHLNGWVTKKSTYIENVGKCSHVLKNIQASDNLYRPPYGKISRAQIAALKDDYQIVMWDVLTGDFSQRLAPEACLKKSIDATSPGAIVVFHDNVKASKNLKYTLPRYLNYFLERGYSFDTL